VTLGADDPSRPSSAAPAAAKPLIVAVDDEPAVLAAVARDLRSEYGGRFRIVRAGSGPEALEALRQARLRSEAAALLLVDQRMPGMSGLTFLAEASQLYPDAKRVLLTAYADTEASIRAINETKLDYYLMKPWDPPEERLYPVLDDLLDEWQAAYQPPYQGISVIGHRWSAASHEVRDFLARNLVPYRWLDVEEDPEAAELVGLADAPAGAGSALPVVLLPDGRSLVQPGTARIAAEIGLRVRAALPFYDLVIVGAGPAGLAAAVYGASEGLSTLLIEHQAPGGQAGTSSRIENYLGFPAGLSGSDLARRAVTQARRFGTEILTPLAATGLRIEDRYRFVTLSDGSEVGCQALLVATGVSYRTLEVPGAAARTGAGVFYGASITEALGTRGAPVFVVGAGNSAGQAALYLARHAEHVTMLVRGSSLAASMSHYLVEQIAVTPNVTVRLRARVTAVAGDGRLESVTIEDLDDGVRSTHAAQAVFVFIGASPHTAWLGDAVARDARGFVLTGPDVVRDGSRPRGWSLRRDPLWLETSVAGIFAAGDVRSRSVKRVASAVGEGAMAVQFVHRHLRSA
jgi:thioredoxin reductase (NADPH)